MKLLSAALIILLISLCKADNCTLYAKLIIVQALELL